MIPEVDMRPVADFIEKTLTMQIIGYDPQRLLPAPAKQHIGVEAWARDHRILGPGRLYFDGGFIKPRTLGKTETGAIQYDEEIMDALVNKHVIQIKVVDKASASFRQFDKQLRHMQNVVYYGERIANLLASKDPRQRKRGRRLRDQRNPAIFQARVDVQKFRETVDGAKLKAFWNTQLGEPYDPSRYRKD